MDTIFYNGIIDTLDSAYPVCSAVAVKNGIITALGNDEEILALKEKETELVNLKGNFMVPGFTDSHMHFLFYGHEKSQIDLSGVRNFEEAAALCREYVDSARQNSRWIRAAGFNQDFWESKEMPTRADLDRIAADVPIVMRRTCHHITVCNTRAMELADLLAERKETTCHEMGFYEDGTPNGVVRELTQNVVSEAMPPLSDEEIKELIRAGAKDAAKQGITEVQTDDFALIPGDCGERILNIYREMAEQNQLDVRIYEQCSVQTPEGLRRFLENGHRTGESYGFFRVGPVKIIADGSLGAHTAAMMKPYLNDPSAKGILNYSDEEMEQLVAMAQEHHLQTAIHCIGDDALRQAVQALRKAHMNNPQVDIRHGIVHCQIMDRAQQNLFRELNLIAYIQPVFLRYDMNIVEDCVGEKLAATSYNWRRFADLGVHLAGGSDCPVEKFDVLPNLEYAVTRTNPETGQSWYPENSLTVREALKAFTLEGAYASFSEQVRGSITIGKYADLTVMDRNLLKIPPKEIHNVKILLTMTGGKLTYREGI